MIKSYLASAYVAAAFLFLALLPAQALARDIVTLTQVSSGRFLTAQSGGDFSVVTTANPNADTRWHVFRLASGARIFMHEKTRRFLDAHEVAQKDFRLVTRPRQTFDRTQNWFLLKGVGGLNIMQESSGRFMDAHEVPELEYGAVSRPKQDNTTQQWRMTKVVP